MAASAWRVYNEAKKYLQTGDIDLNTSALRWKVVSGASAALVSNYTRSTFASCGAAVANTAIKSVTGIAVTALAGSATQKFDASDKIFTASGGNASSIQYAVIGVSGGKALAWCKLSTAAFTVTSGNTLTLTLHANGIFVLQGGTT